MAKRYSRPRDASARDPVERAAGLRSQRLEELFREELTSLLEIEINDPALADARITRAELSLDGSRARVWFALASSFSDADAGRARAAFERASGFLRSRLCDALPVKRIPELTFRYDPVALPPAEDESPQAEDE
jgi:ribosome-binding factor A